MSVTLRQSLLVVELALNLLSLGPSVDVMGADVSEVDRGIVNSGAGPIHKTLDNNITSLGCHRVTCPCGDL